MAGILPQAAANPPLPAAALDGQVQAWRHVQPNEDVPRTVIRLRQLGFSEATVSGILPELMRIWQLGPEREFGDIGVESQRRVRAVDRRYELRLRTLELRMQQDTYSEPEMAAARKALDEEWDRDVRATLAEDEIAEFSILNSEAAQRMRNRVRGLGLSSADLRALCIRQQQYEDDAAGALKTVTGRAAEITWDRMALYRDVELVLGPERFPSYLRRVDPRFETMQEELSRIPNLPADVAAKFWWAISDFRVGQLQLSGTATEREVAYDKLVHQTRARLAEELAPEILGAVEKSPLRWMIPRERTRDRKPRKLDGRAMKLSPPVG